MYAQRYERIGDPPALWTWFTNGSVYRNDEYIRSSSFYNSDTFAEFICDRSGPDATEYPPVKQYHENKYRSGWTHRWWSFDQLKHIADYAAIKLTILAEPADLVERLRKYRQIERRIR